MKNIKHHMQSKKPTFAIVYQWGGSKGTDIIYVENPFLINSQKKIDVVVGVWRLKPKPNSLTVDEVIDNVRKLDKKLKQDRKGMIIKRFPAV